MFTINDIPLQKIHEGERVDLTQEEREQMLSEWNIEAERIEKNKTLQYQRDRSAEYPPVTDYLDGVVKGDQAQIDAYIAACQAVKAKYPK
jgi:hypothetical protein